MNGHEDLYVFAIREQSIADGGGTFPAPASGYVIGGAACAIVARELRVQDIEYMLAQTVGAPIGTWRDNATGKWWIDAVTVVQDRGAALALARTRGELAIWDVAQRAEIRV